MATFFLFFLVLILIVVFIVLSFVGSILGGILNFFGIGSNKRRNFSNKNSSEKNSSQGSHQSQEGAKRMRKFKNIAEDADYEVMKNEE